MNPSSEATPGAALLKQRLGSTALRPDGKRQKLHPAEVSGRFHSFQRLLFPAILVTVFVLPWIRVSGHPLVMFDVPARRFFFFGLTLNTQDFPLAFFILSGLAFILLVLSALAGRVWCGYVCPQTVVLEGLFRPIERLFEGRAAQRTALDKAPWTPAKVFRKAGKQVVFACLAVLMAHGLLAYFATGDDILGYIRKAPTENWLAFAWTYGAAAIMYFDMTWFREQLCIVICPYGRLQSVLADQDTVVVGYDAKRGEPRGKPSTAGAGDCIDCKRCVRVCPTGMDIRLGMQLECLGCTRCIDACDAIMVSLKKAPGLIRYDSLAGLEHQPRHFWRGRVWIYLVAALAGLTATTLYVTNRQPFHATLLRPTGSPHEVMGDLVLHRYVLHLTNKSPDPRRLSVKVTLPEGVELIAPVPEQTLEPFESRHVPLLLQSRKDARPGLGRVQVVTTDLDTQESVPSSLPLLLGNL